MSVLHWSFTSVVILSLNAVISVCNDEILSYWKWPPPPVVEDFSFFFVTNYWQTSRWTLFFQQMGLGSKLNFQFFKTLLTPHCTVAGLPECMGMWGLVVPTNFWQIPSNFELQTQLQSGGRLHLQDRLVPTKICDIPTTL